MRIEGLETLDYLDNLCEKQRFTEQGDALTFESEVTFKFLLIGLSCGHRVMSRTFTEGFLLKTCSLFTHLLAGGSSLS